MKQPKKIWINIDPFSLQLRLTIGIATFSTLILGNLAAWTSWKMQQILIDSRKYNIEKIAERLPHDVQFYSEMMQPEIGLQNFYLSSLRNLFTIWVILVDFCR